MSPPQKPQVPAVRQQAASPSKPQTPSPLQSVNHFHVSSKRPRSQTDALLPTSYDASSNRLPARPAAERHLQAYTDQRLQKSLACAQAYLTKRKISPRAEHTYMLWKQTVKDALTANSLGERKEYTAEVRLIERLIDAQSFLQPDTSSERQQELQAKLLELSELKYYLRYGDYIKILPNQLRVYASNKKIQNWEELSGQHYWKTIAERLDQEDKEADEARAARRNLDGICQDVNIAVAKACAELGIDRTLALWSIHEYGTHNKYAHGDLKSMRENGSFNCLGWTLLTDLQDIDSIISDTQSTWNKAELRRVIRREIEQWFDDSMDPLNPDVWKSTPALDNEYIDAQKRLKADIENPNVEANQKLEDEKKARQKEASSQGQDKGMERLASTEVPYDVEAELSASTEQVTLADRIELTARKTKLEHELREVERQMKNLRD